MKAPTYPRIIAELANSEGFGCRLVEHEDHVVFEDDTFNDESLRDANGDLPFAYMLKYAYPDGVLINIDDDDNNAGPSAHRSMLIFLAELLIKEQADDFADGGRDALGFLKNRLLRNSRTSLFVSEPTPRRSFTP